MGCGASIPFVGKKPHDNWHINSLWFTADHDGFPFDRVHWAVDKSKEPSEHAHDDAAVKKHFESLQKYIEEHKKKWDAVPSDKTEIVFEKWNSKDAAKHFKDVLESFAANGHGAAADQKEGGDEAPATGDAAAAEEEKKVDAGAPAAGMTGMAQVPNPFDKLDGSGEFKGAENFGALVLRNMLINHSFFDAVKQCALDWEGDHEKGVDNTGLQGAAASAAAHVASKVSGEQTVWLSGYLTGDQVSAVQKLSGKGDKHIFFPFISAGWATKEEAVNAFEHSPKPGEGNIAGKSLGAVTKTTGWMTFGLVGGNSEPQKVIFEVEKAAAFSSAGVRHVVHRLKGNVTSHSEADGTHSFKVSAVKVEAQTVKAWEEKAKAK
jgi:hypothetical protein